MPVLFAFSDGVIDFEEFEQVYVGLQSKATAPKATKPDKNLPLSSDQKATMWTKKKNDNPVAGLFKRLFDQ